MTGKILHMGHWNDIDEYGRTKLHYAANYGITHLVEFLLDEGVDVNAQDNNGWTALHFAAQNSHFELIDLLLENKANPSLCDKQGNIPLWVAAINAAGKYAGVNSLLRNEAAPYHKNYHGRSPMYIANTIKTGLVDTFMPYENDNIMRK